MLAKSYLDFKSKLDQQGSVLTYCGAVSESMLAALGETLKQKMSATHTDMGLAKRVFSIFIELVQNIIRYSDARDEADPPGAAPVGGFIMVGIEKGHYFVVCGNSVQNNKVDRLRARLEHLATLDREQIRQYYREKLREPPDEGSLGATIGLIEIARRSSLPIEYDFSPNDAETSFFCLKAFV